MKIFTLILTYLFGAVFFIFGSIYFLNLMPAQPMEGDIATFSNLLMKTHYMVVIKIIETIAGAMILFNFKRPLAWLMILPIVINILMFELLVAHQPGMGILLLAINAFMLYQNREKYQSIWS